MCTDRFDRLLMSRVKRHQILLWSFISSVSVVCYLNSCWGDFVFDDNNAIVSNIDVVSDSSLIDVFTHDFWGAKVSHSSSHKSYRPFTILTFRWNYWLAGDLNPFLFHLTNVIIHPIVCILYYEVCQHVCQGGHSPKVTDWAICPLVASLMFAVHPVHTESIASIVGRAELMSAVGYFSALLCYIKSSSLGSSLWSMVGVLITLILAGSAMLFKEQGVTVLGICLVYDVLFNMKSGVQMKRFAARIVLVLVFTATILIIRMATGTPTFKPVDNPASFSNSSLTRVLSYNYIYALNCWLLLNPSWLCFDWSMGCIPLLDSVTDYRFIAVIASWLAFVILLIFCFLRREGHYKRLVKISLAMLVIPYLPASNLVVPVGFVVAERVLYLPSSGWCLLFSIGLSIMIKHQKMCGSLFFILILVFISKSMKRSQQWQTEQSLFVSGLSVCPNNAKVFYNVGKIMSDAGQAITAEAAYRRAIMLYPEYDQALNNLGNLLKETNKITEAEEMLQRAVSVNAGFAVAWMNLGIIKATLNKIEEAELCYKNALEFRRKYPDAYYNLGNLYIDCGHLTDAAKAFKSAIKFQKNHVKAWNNLGLLYENQGMYEEAERVLREAIKQIPNDHLLYYSLGVLLGRMHRLEEAQELLSKAVSLNPTLADYHANLGVIYHLMKQHEKAEQLYSHALQLKPDLAIAKDNLMKLLKSKGKLSETETIINDKKVL